MTRCVSLAFKLLLLAALLVGPTPIRAAPTAVFTPRHLVRDDNTNATTTTTSPASNATTSAGLTGTPKFTIQNALDAQKLNTQFLALKATDSCVDGSIACVNSSFAQCVSGKWAVTPCPGSTACVALPLVNTAGTSLTCDSKEDAARRFTDAGVTGGTTGSEQASSGASTAEGAEATGDLECDDQETSASPTAQSVTTDIPSSSSAVPSNSATFTAPASATVVSSTQTEALTRAAAATTIFLNRRQITLTPASAPATLFSSSPAIPSASSSVILPFVSASGSVSAPTASASALLTPTDATSIPAAGITTVTVVSTVTITCNDASTSGLTATAISSAAPIVTISQSPPIFTSAPISAASGTLTASVSPPSSALSPSQSGFISSFPPSLSASGFITTVSPTTAPVAGGFSFSTAPVVTATPSSGVNNAGAAGASDISKLLTATV